MYATTLVLPLVYSIISGPLTQPVQTTNSFNSLPAGTYTIKVSDGASNSLTQDAIVAGNYLQPDFDPIKTSPYCVGNSDGQLIGNRLAATGNGPFTWQLIAPSLVTTAPQSTDTFNNLPAGNYTMRLTDGCGDFRTMVVTLSPPPSSNLIFTTPPRINMIGCDSAIITIPMRAEVYRFPLTCTFETNAGIFTTTTPTITDTTSSCCGFFVLEQILPGFAYGDFVKIKITDNCGNTVSSPTHYAKPFVFCASKTSFFDNCNYYSSTYFDLNNTGCDAINSMYTSIKSPVTYQVTDPLTNLVVDAGTLIGMHDNNGYNLISGFAIKPLPTNKTYNLKVTDGCGKVFNQAYFVPDPVIPAPAIDGKNIYPDACVDSAAYAFVYTDNFKTEPRLVLLSGPAMMGSSKPGYAYQDAYRYPDTLDFSGVGNTAYRFDISNLSVGTYQFKVIDSCGTGLFDSLVIRPADVTDFAHHIWSKKGCLGQNEIHYKIDAANGFIDIRNLSTGANWIKYFNSQNFTTPVSDSLLNLPSGTYQLTLNYQAYFGIGTPANNGTLTCQVITDTIIIEGYQTPVILAGNYIKCKTGIVAELIPDSTKGMPPFQYEIINGPQIFPKQNSNLFNLIAPGTYTARIYDGCGNASTTQVTLDPIGFPPVTTIPSGCNGIDLFYGSSGFYSYNWYRPDGTVYSGDTLSINPVTPADTGTYYIQKIVNINGCIDTFYSPHHVTLTNAIGRTATICHGNVVTIGIHNYSKTGLYADTLINSFGCDSIINLNLTVVPFKGDSITRTICSGDSFIVNGHAYTQTGIYRDTVTTTTCDSVIVLNLTVNAVKRDSITRTICAGESVTVNGNAYTQTGIYRDTIGTSTCDSLVILNLTVAAPKRDSISKVICLGESFTVNGHAYSQTGIYRDTIATATCDSIVILNLSVVQNLPVRITASAYNINHGDIIQLNADAAISYQWSAADGLISDPVIRNPAATIYSSSWIYLKTGSNNACVFRDSVFITVNNTSTPCAGAYIYLPNAFTPGGNGLNDEFKIFAKNVALKYFQVFNRWGEKVFESDDINKGWNGTYKGKIIAGAYVYIVSYRLLCNNSVRILKGNIILIK